MNRAYQRICPIHELELDAEYAATRAVDAVRLCPKREKEIEKSQERYHGIGNNGNNGRYIASFDAKEYVDGYMKKLFRNMTRQNTETMLSIWEAGETNIPSRNPDE